VPPTHITAQGCTAMENKTRKNVTLENQNITQMRQKYGDYEEFIK